jgi:hypothetical protein
VWEKITDLFSASRPNPPTPWRHKDRARFNANLAIGVPMRAL